MEEDFKRWLKRAKPRERYVYHTGYLPQDRTKMVEVPVVRGEFHRMAVNSGPVHHLAKLVMDAAEAGYVHLLQERIGDGKYKYIAERR